MILPNPSFVLESDEAVAAVAATSRWTPFALADRRIALPEEGLIALVYRSDARRDDEHEVAHRSSTYRRRGNEDWQAVQGQQTPPLAA